MTEKIRITRPLLLSDGHTRDSLGITHIKITYVNEACI